MINQAKITLVGAGPGDPDLLTLKGLKAIQSADVVCYDALCNEALLVHAPNHARKIYVGKRANQHKMKQSEINLLLVQYALTHGHVVRLKGGDPFVFGRGHEEMSYAESFNIPVEVIPGISSAIAVPELQGIPVTHRGISQSFWVITGTTSTGELSKDIALAAQSTATVVILMGMNKLPEIVQTFQLHGKMETPAMVIQNGSLPNEKVAVGTVETIQSEVVVHQLGSPAIIVIGNVVGLHAHFAEMAYNSNDETWTSSFEITTH